MLKSRLAAAACSPKAAGEKNIQIEPEKLE